MNRSVNRSAAGSAAEHADLILPTDLPFHQPDGFLHKPLTASGWKRRALMILDGEEVGPPPLQRSRPGRPTSYGRRTSAHRWAHADGTWPANDARYAEICPTDGRWKLLVSPDGRWEWEAPFCSATGCLADCSTLFGTCWPHGFEEDAILMSRHDVGRGTGGWGSCSAARLVLGTACPGPPGHARPWDASCSGRAAAMAAAAALGLVVRGTKQKPDPQGAAHGSARKRRQGR